MPEFHVLPIIASPFFCIFRILELNEDHLPTIQLADTHPYISIFYIDYVPPIVSAATVVVYTLANHFPPKGYP